MTGFKLPDKAPKIKLKEQAPDARMFTVLPIRAIHDKRLTRGDLINLMALCSYCSQGGFTTVANSTLGKFRGVSAPYISKSLTRLKNFGYVETVRGGYTGLRGSLKRVIYDANLRLRDVVSISQASIQEEVMKHSKVSKLKQSDNKPKVTNTRLSYEDALLVVSSSLKSEADLLRLEKLVQAGISRDALLEAFS